VTSIPDGGSSPGYMISGQPIYSGGKPVGPVSKQVRGNARNVDANDLALEVGPGAVREALNGAVLPLITPGALSAEGATEESAAREWVLMHHDAWRYDHGIACFYQWDGSRWKKDDQRLAFHLIGEHLRIAGSLLGKKSLAPKATVARGIEAFVIANPKIGVPHDRWDSDDFLLGTPSGTVDLRTGRTRAASAADFLTRSTKVAPKAGKPERWIQFIGEVTNGDRELGRFLQQTLGYCLTGSTREHALFFVFGAGKNGKSVLLNTATRILGDYATTAAMDTFTASHGDKHPTDLARLDGARLVAASETEEGRAWAESRIKQLTGGDRIAARFMRQDFFEFTPKFKLFIVGNFQPVLHNVDAAMRRRFNIIPFVHTPPQPDMELEDKLAAEHPQILAWMIEGCRDWISNGLCRPAAVVKATERYFEDQDIVGQWVTERCDERNGALGKPKDLFESWGQFAGENGEAVGSQKALAGILQKRGFRPIRTSAGRFWEGIDVRKHSRFGHDA
jgi:putative DNA primase/helicase